MNSKFLVKTIQEEIQHAKNISKFKHFNVAEQSAPSIVLRTTCRSKYPHFIILAKDEIESFLDRGSYNVVQKKDMRKGAVILKSRIDNKIKQVEYTKEKLKP